MPPARVAVYVTPKASRDEVVGWRGSELAVKVTSPPEGGKANLAVCRVVAKAVGVPKTSIEVVRGSVSRHKQLEITGVSAEDLTDALGQPDPGLL